MILKCISTLILVLCILSFVDNTESKPLSIRTYITTEEIFHKDTSPCNSLCSNGTTSCHNCSTTTLNELHKVRNGIVMVDNYLYEIIFLSGTHIVHLPSNYSQLLLFKPTNKRRPTLRMSLRGDGDVNIVCMSNFHLKFLFIQQLNISNIQFKNCSGTSDEFLTNHYTVILYANNDTVYTKTYDLMSKRK